MENNGQTELLNFLREQYAGNREFQASVTTTLAELKQDMALLKVQLVTTEEFGVHKERLSKHELSLYGVDGKNGMRGRLEELEDKIEELIETGSIKKGKDSILQTIFNWIGGVAAGAIVAIIINMFIN